MIRPLRRATDGAQFRFDFLGKRCKSGLGRRSETAARMKRKIYETLISRQGR